MQCEWQSFLKGEKFSHTEALAFERGAIEIAVTARLDEMR